MCKPGLDYFKRQFSTSTKSNLLVFKGCRLFLLQKIYAMKVDADKVKEALLPILFLSPKEQLDQLLSELSAYLTCAVNASNIQKNLEFSTRVGAIAHQ